MIEGEIYQSFRVMVLGVMSGYGKYGQDSCITSRVRSTEIHNLCTLYIHTRDHGKDF